MTREVARFPRPDDPSPGETPAFEQALATALQTASLAPSSHNCQPWALGYVNGRQASQQTLEALDRAISSGRGQRWERSGPSAEDAFAAAKAHGLLVLALDRDRELRSLGAHALEMNLSCGMFLLLLIKSFELQGWSARVVWKHEGAGDELPGVAAWPHRWHPLVVVAVTAQARREAVTEAGDVDKLLRLARQRITNRAPYTADQLPVGHLEELAHAARGLRSAGFGSNLQVTVLSDRTTIKAVGGFVAENAAIDFAHSAAWRETYSFIRFTKAQMRDAEDGFAITHLFGPLPGLRRGFLRLLLAPATMAVLKHLGQARAIARGLGALVGEAPGILVAAIEGPSTSPIGQVAAGARLLDLWIAVADSGIALHPVSVILQHPRIREHFQARFELDGRVVLVCRAGYPTAPAQPSYRRTDPSSFVTNLAPASQG